MHNDKMVSKVWNKCDGIITNRTLLSLFFVLFFRPQSLQCPSFIIRFPLCYGFSSEIIYFSIQCLLPCRVQIKWKVKPLKSRKYTVNQEGFLSIYDYQNCTYFFSTEANEAFKFRIACVGSVLGFCGLIEPPDNNQQCVKRVERGGVRAKEGRKEGRKGGRRIVQEEERKRILRNCAKGLPNRFILVQWIGGCG